MLLCTCHLFLQEVLRRLQAVLLHMSLKLTLFFPACGCQVGQFPVFLRQLEFAVIKARSPSEALFGQTPVRGQQHLPVKLELLKLLIEANDLVHFVVVL